MEPEYFEDDYTYVDNNTGEVIHEEKLKNPKYLEGAKRKIFEVLNDTLPVSQFYQISESRDEGLYVLIGYDVLLILGFAAIGAAAFKRRDLK